MKNISSRRIQDINNSTGFSEDIIEKVIRLEDLLKEIFRHPYLIKRLLLKGGTALNFCCFNRMRLSVDIDLNYVGSADIEIMRNERRIIEEAIIRIVKDNNYSVLREPRDEHAGGKYRLGYKNLWGNSKNLEVDINYLYRIPIGTPQKKIFKAFNNSNGFEISIVSKEELFAGKISAALDRTAARDIYDIFNLVNYLLNYDKLLFRKAVIFLGASKREDFRKVCPEKLKNISERDLKNSLYPLLPQEERIDKKILFNKTIPFIANLLNFTKDEEEFLNRYLDKGEYRPDILFSKYPDLIPKLEKHPALLWKKLHIEKHLKINR